MAAAAIVATASATFVWRLLPVREISDRTELAPLAVD